MGAAQNYTLNGMAFNASDAGSLDGWASFSKTVPYLGIGFGKPAGRLLETVASPSRTQR